MLLYVYANTIDNCQQRVKKAWQTMLSTYLYVHSGSGPLADLIQPAPSIGMFGC